MKAVLRFNPLALNDLSEIKAYISDDLENPAAGVAVVRKIMERISSLQEFPDTGSLLTDYIGVRTEYRFLVCDSYLAFYKHEGEIVSVYRVLYRKRDYLRVLFDE